MLGGRTAVLSGKREKANREEVVRWVDTLPCISRAEKLIRRKQLVNNAEGQSGHLDE